jgi:hypothetical protein
LQGLKQVIQEQRQEQLLKIAVMRLSGIDLVILRQLSVLFQEPEEWQQRG